MMLRRWWWPFGKDKDKDDDTKAAQQADKDQLCVARVWTPEEYLRTLRALTEEARMALIDKEKDLLRARVNDSIKAAARRGEYECSERIQHYLDDYICVPVVDELRSRGLSVEYKNMSDGTAMLGTRAVLRISWAEEIPQKARPLVRDPPADQGSENGGDR